MLGTGGARNVRNLSEVSTVELMDENVVEFRQIAILVLTFKKPHSQDVLIWLSIRSIDNSPAWEGSVLYPRSLPYTMGFLAIGIMGVSFMLSREYEVRRVY